jgi:putative salt-induced outer membrane protein YdiY
MRKRLFTFVLFLFLLGTSSLYAQIDSLVMNTGEVLVGEVKSLSQGIIVIETEYSDDDFRVEWDQVSYIQTERKYIITMSNGERYNGPLLNPGKDGKVLIIDRDEGDVVANILDVVYLKSVEEKFLSRVDLLMSIGYSLTKANESHQISARLNAGYLSNTFGIDLYFNAVRTIQTPDSTTIRTERTEGGLGFRFFIYKDWFALAGTDFLQSTEQKLTLRSLTKGGIGNYIVNTNRMYFVLAGGAAWNYEDYDDPAISDRNSAEAFAAVEYNIFDIGDLDLKTNLTGYPSLTESGRFRTDFSFDLKYEFPLDFFINLGFTLNYDNQPVEGASETDYVLQTTFGWEL